MTPPRHRPDLRGIGESAFMEVLSTLLRLSSTVANPATSTALSGGVDQMTSTVHLTGPKVSGSVCVQFPMSFIIHAVHIVTGVGRDTAEADGLVDDTAGELANMVAGRVAARLAEAGYVCGLGTPSVSRGSPLPIENQTTVGDGRADLICEGHRLVVDIRCHYTAP